MLRLRKEADSLFFLHDCYVCHSDVWHLAERTALLLQEIYKDRKKFSKSVFEVASSDLVNMGISVVSYTLKDIKDEEVLSSELRLPSC